MYPRSPAAGIPVCEEKRFFNLAAGVIIYGYFLVITIIINRLSLGPEMGF